MSSPAGSGNGSGKHVRREDKESARGRRTETVTHGTTGLRLAGALAGLGVLLGVLVWSPWSQEPASNAAAVGATGPLLPTYGAEWRTAAGHSYRITVTPAVVVTDRAAQGGCYPSPAPGRVNVRFDVRIENLSHHREPVPEVGFGTNLGAEGRVRPRVLDYDRTTHPIELAPRVKAAACSAAASLGPDGHQPLPADTGRTWEGLVADVDPGAASSPAGLRLIVQYREVDVEARDGDSPAAVVVPFSFRPVAPEAP